MRMGVNHSFIHLNPLSMLARRRKVDSKAAEGNVGPKGKGAASYVEHVKEHLLE